MKEIELEISASHDSHTRLYNINRALKTSGITNAQDWGNAQKVIEAYQLADKGQLPKEPV